MSNGSVMEEVPEDKVCEIVMSYIADGMTRITLTKNPSTGRWRIEAR